MHNDDEDSENVDPASFGSKRSKTFDGTPTKKILSVSTYRTTPSTEPSIFLTSAGQNSTSSHPFGSGLGMKRKAEALPASSTPLTAPAGRSPKHKRVGILSRKQSSFSPFRRIDPPSFNLANTSREGVPFSLDAALSGTLSTHVVSKDLTGESVPKGWIFDIHEDTADQEAANLMEHSACTLDISDDESVSLKHEDKGKENIPPSDCPQQPQTVAQEEKAARSRRTAVLDAMLDEGEERLPLGDLPAVDFYDVGLTEKSEVVFGSDEAKPSKLDAPQIAGGSIAETTSTPTTEHLAASHTSVSA